MIQTLSDPEGGSRTLYLRPNRALSLRAWAQWFLAIAVTCMLVAFCSAWFGNVFAPFFAVLNLMVLTLAFVVVWQAGGRVECIELAPDCITVRRKMGGFIGGWMIKEVGRFHPAWVRLIWREGNMKTAGRRLLLRSHGMALEIGAFLADEERNQLADSLRRALIELKAGPGAPGMG